METRAQLAFEEKLFSICKLKFYWSFSDIINQHFKYHPHFDVVNMKCDWESQMWGVWDWKEKNAGTWRRAASLPTIWKFWSRVKTFLSLINLDCMVLLCRLFAKNAFFSFVLNWMFMLMVLRVIVLTLTKCVHPQLCKANHDTPKKGKERHIKTAINKHIKIMNALLCATLLKYWTNTLWPCVCT